ncbi:RHS repeat-associated core domain-containing protein [Agromyces soli]|uniref:Polymorphic toxin type 24 domain-containing protein n=1 Tax=Agromyces soli TaxID=659012 RepID=A0ABY4B0H8_9MICO|nr:polymorphic toxin type 24 domain-containing protein [Agromyces soli]UOE27516.1 polymorphic toxin type 24 domain-containing protein [Agromyces soli]
MEYEFDPVGNRTGKSVHATDGSSGVTTTSYAHGAGGAGVHAVTGASVSVDGGAGVSSSYGYDGAGRMVSRTEAGVSSQLGWDAESELVSLQSDGSGASGGSGSSFVYSADGDRVVRSDASGVTVYLPGGQEVSISTSGAVSAARYYGFGGATVAVRVGRGLAGVSSLVSDAHGTPVASVPNTKRPDTTKVDRMYTDPFGAARGGSGAATVPGDRQFLGLTRDGSGLTLLGARYYDETLGRFLSVDPLLDLSDPQQWNGYAYANNNPTSMSDPSGLAPIGKNDYTAVDRNGNERTMGSGVPPRGTVLAKPSTIKPPVSVSSASAGAWIAGTAVAAQIDWGRVLGSIGTALTAALSSISWAAVAAAGSGVSILSMSGDSSDSRANAEAAKDAAASDISTPATPPDDDDPCNLFESLDCIGKSDSKIGFREEAAPSSQTGILEGSKLVSGRFPRSAGPGETLVRRGADGRVTNYQVYGADGLPIKRVDVTGRSHGGVDTPHVVEFERNINPHTGGLYIKPGPGVRPATPEELLGL